ncbi:glutathione S-transferase family protein [Crenobacter caeni]|uniref:Glutathione S-transferase family protein n=1 Tax=Crenobacter caeni TaxID=2705474 RepID=A0A6B2KN63_9NEIS|nr:glutathione S-transferase N-terminal domain-containing protein [Crenobacter caeni]NDV11604.1 glutathione S-transferase family protein [Crenobacter caeni]
MIQLYTWGTPNGRKISIALEELGLAYGVHPVDIGAGAQFAPAFLEISPNNKIPAIVDPDGPDGQPLALFESGAILVYLAEKTGRLLPAAGEARYRVLQWLMFQMGGFGPMLGQAHHFLRYAPETVPYAQKRYHDEALRLYRVLDTALAGQPYVAGDEYSIADIALYPWAAKHDWHCVDLEPFPHVARWLAEVGARPAVARGMAVPAA